MEEGGGGLSFTIAFLVCLDCGSLAGDIFQVMMEMPRRTYGLSRKAKVGGSEVEYFSYGIVDGIDQFQLDV